MAIWIKNDVDPDALQIRWKSPTWYLDVIDPDEFNRQCKDRLSWHECVSRDGRYRAKAKFLKTVIGDTAILDYGHPSVLAVNQKNGMIIGCCLITFTDSKRTAVKDVTWIMPNKTEQRDAASTSWDALPDLDNKFIFPGREHVEKTLTAKKRRRLQSRFRWILFEAYDRKCCISECDVQEALEAVHLYPAAGRSSYDPRNGILLRSDLHRLLDKGLLRIDPQSRKVILTGTAEIGNHYKHLAGKMMREPKNPKYRPDKRVLSYRGDPPSKVA